MTRAIKLPAVNSEIAIDKWLSHSIPTPTHPDILHSIPKHRLLNRDTESPCQRKQSEMGKIKKLKDMLQKRLKTDKKFVCVSLYGDLMEDKCFTK